MIDWIGTDNVEVWHLTVNFWSSSRPAVTMMTWQAVSTAQLPPSQCNVFQLSGIVANGSLLISIYLSFLWVNKVKRIIRNSKSRLRAEDFCKGSKCFLLSSKGNVFSWCSFLFQRHLWAVTIGYMYQSIVDWSCISPGESKVSETSGCLSAWMAAVLSRVLSFPGRSSVPGKQLFLYNWGFIETNFGSENLGNRGVSVSFHLGCQNARLYSALFSPLDQKQSNVDPILQI